MLSARSLVLFVFLALGVHEARANHTNFKSQVLDPKQIQIKTGTYTEATDHFDPSNAKSFQQRYFIAKDYAAGSSSAPVIYYSCGEINCLDGYPIPAAIDNYARDLKAYVVILEHRYYGKSQPFTEMTSENLKFLTIEQASEDLASFQKFAVSEFGLFGKWIIAGGSYSGTLASYYRINHPELTVGALVSSGLEKSELSFENFDQTIAKDLSADCLAAVQDVTRQVENAIGDQARFAEIKSVFGAQSIRSPTDVLSIVDGMVAYSVLFGRKAVFCSALLQSGDHLSNFANAGAATIAKAGFTLLDLTMVQGAESTLASDYEKSAGLRPWLYQMCTQLGAFQVAYHDPAYAVASQLLDLKSNLDACKTLFGVEAAPDENWINTHLFDKIAHGFASNMFFTNGSLDPFALLSITQVNGDLQKLGISTFKLDGFGHCADLGALQGNQGMVDQAQEKFTAVARQWLSE